MTNFLIEEYRPDVGDGVFVLHCQTDGRRFNYNCDDPKNHGNVVCPGPCGKSEKWADIDKLPKEEE